MHARHGLRQKEVRKLPWPLMQQKLRRPLPVAGKLCTLQELLLKLPEKALAQQELPLKRLEMQPLEPPFRTETLLLRYPQRLLPPTLLRKLQTLELSALPVLR